MTDKLSPARPGEVLLEEFIKPLGLSQNRLANNLSQYDLDIAQNQLGKHLEVGLYFMAK